MQLPNDNAFVTLLFALLRLGVIPVLAMPSQRALDIDALIELAQPVAYVIHGENHAELARQMAHKHACLRHVLVAGETVSDDFTPLFSLHGERQAWPQPDVSATALLCHCSQAAQPARPNSSRADMPTIAITSALLLNCAASANRACISPSSRWRITFRWPAPVFWGTLACGGKVVLTDSASCDEVMPLIAQERVTHVALVPALAQLWVQAGEWEDSDLSSLRVIQAGGARLDPTLAEQVIATFDCTPCNRFSVWRKACSVLPGWTIRMPPFSTAGAPVVPSG